MTVPGNVRLSRHVGDLDDDGHDTHGIIPVVVYAECNTPPTTSVALDFDTVYDVDGVDLSGVLPAAIGLTSFGTAFQADEDGLWLVHFGASIVVAPGVTGEINVRFPGYGYNNKLFVKAAANDPEWSVDRLMPMRLGQDFSVAITTSGGNALFTYAVLDIIRVARSVS